MDIKYEIHTLKNAGGDGGNRKYVALHRPAPLTMEQITEHIERSCSLTKADVLAVLTELRHLAKEQLQEGRRFYILGIGWISLTAGLDRDAQKKGYKVTGKDIYPKAVRFQAEEKFFQEICDNVSFEKSKFTTKSVAYTEETLWAKLTDYLQHHDFISCRILQQEFGLSKYIANKWLTHFISVGKLRKSGVRHNIIYLLNDASPTSEQ